MSQYWLRDEAGGVLGPVSIQVVRDLAAAGCVTEASHVSRDGQVFLRMAQVPEVMGVVRPAPAAQRQGADDRRAAQVLEDLERLRTLTPSELFGVPVGSSAEDFRRGFLELAKRYHPARLPPDATPALREACHQAFAHLTAQMKRVEAERTTVPRSATPTATPIQAILQTSSTRGIVVEFATPVAGRPELVVRVPSTDLSPFTCHRLVNFATGGLFLSMEQPLSIGTRLGLTLCFAQPARDVHSRGTVVLENVIRSAAQPVGMGVRLDGLSGPDRAFIQRILATRTSGATY